MIINIYVTYDSKAAVYSRPFFAQARGIALRTFGDISNDPEHPIGKHPEDYTLFEIGSYDDITGDCSMLEAKLSLGTALEHKAK